jgi:signal transduction histidine kinase
MFHSLRFRVLVALILVIAVAVGVVAFFASQATTGEFQRYVERGGMMRHQRFEMFLADHYMRTRSWSGVQPLVEQMGQITGERVVLADAGGQIVADSAEKLVGQTVARDWAEPVALIVDRGLPVGAVYTNPLGPADDPQRVAFLASVNRAVLLAAVVASLAAVLLTLGLSRRILGPIEALTAAARRMEKGDLSQRVEVQSRDEIGELARAFNAMADGLAHLEKLRHNMVTDVSHELRTPLSNIRGYLEALRDGVIEPNPEITDSLYEEAMLLNRLVNDLQELSLAEAGQLRLERRAVAPADVVNRALEAARPRAEAKGIALQVDLPEDLPLVDADPQRVGQVLGNLLSNGLTYTPSGGGIVVGARARESEVEISVRDTGAGIPAEDIPYVFERFYRADKSRSRATGGAGLGLAIARQLVEAHGGRIWVESTEGQGSTFTFALPISISSQEKIDEKTQNLVYSNRRDVGGSRWRL